MVSPTALSYGRRPLVFVTEWFDGRRGEFEKKNEAAGGCATNGLHLSTSAAAGRRRRAAAREERGEKSRRTGEATRRRQNPFGEPLPRLGPSAALSSSRYKTPRGRRSVAPSRRFVSPHATPDTTGLVSPAVVVTKFSPVGLLHKR